MLGNSGDIRRSGPRRIADIQHSVIASGCDLPGRSAEHYQNRNGMMMRYYARHLLRAIIQQFRAVGNVIEIGRKQDE